MYKIGVIDSGIGGVSIVKAALNLGVVAEYIYILDNKYHPYGEKSKEELCAITFMNIEKLIDLKADIIVLACNTATSACVENLRRIFNINIIGTEPAIKPASAMCKEIAILATPYTQNSSRLNNLLKKHPSNYYFPNCTNLAYVIENNFNELEYLEKEAEKILNNYKFCDGIVIGCTHYSFILNQIKKILPQAMIFDPSFGVASKIKNTLKHDIEPILTRPKLKLISTNGLYIDKKYEFIKNYLNIEIFY